MLYDVTEDLNIGRTAEPSQSGYNSKWMQEIVFCGFYNLWGSYFLTYWNFPIWEGEMLLNTISENF